MFLFKLILFCLLLFPLAAQAGDLARVVAVINNDAITSVQLDKAIAAQEGPAIPDVRSQTLNRLIEESLMRQRAEALGLQVSDEEVEAAVQDVLRQNRLTQAQLDEALRTQKLDPKDYRQSLRQQILRYKLLGREVQSRTEVSSREIQEYYDQHPDEFREPPTVTIKRLGFPVTPKTEKTMRGLADEALKRLRSGASFEETLTRYLPEGAEGGEMGSLVVTDLSPAFAAAIKDLPDNGCSEVLVTSEALHLLIVAGRSPGKIRPLEEVLERIHDRLAEQKKATAASSWMEELKQKAHIEIRL